MLISNVMVVIHLIPLFISLTMVSTTAAVAASSTTPASTIVIIAMERKRIRVKGR